MTTMIQFDRGVTRFIGGTGHRSVDGAAYQPLRPTAGASGIRFGLPQERKIFKVADGSRRI